MTSRVFTYSKHTSLKGILRHFYDLETLWENIEVHGSSISKNYPTLYPSYAFDFNDDAYWLGEKTQDTITLTFCLKHFFVMPFGFEMQTSKNGHMIPKMFQFSSSIDNKSYINILTLIWNF